MQADLKRLKRDLNSAKTAPSLLSQSDAPDRPSQQWRARPVVISVVCIAVALLLAVCYEIVSLYTRKPYEPPFQNFTITKLTDTGNVVAAAISPDGKFVVNVEKQNGVETLHLRNVSTSSDTEIAPPIPNHYASVQFSPDGDYLYFRRVDRFGEFAGDLYYVPVLGGTPELVLKGDFNTMMPQASGVSFSPDSQSIAFNILGFGERRLATCTLGGHEQSKLQAACALGGREERGFLMTQRQEQIAADVDPAWSPDGKIIVTAILDKDGRASILQTVPISPGLELTSTLFGIENERQRTILASGEIAFTGLKWLPDQRGLLVSYKKKHAPDVQIGFVSYQGRFLPVTIDTNSYSGLSISRDGKTIATVQDEQSFRLYLMPAAQINEGAGTPITARGVANLFEWEDEGSLSLELANADARKFFRMNDRGEQKTLLIDATRYRGHRGASCQKGRYIVFEGTDLDSSSGNVNLWRLDSLNASVARLTAGAYDESPACSPDGKWVYYVQPYDKQPRIQRVSIDGGPPSTVIEMFVLPFGLGVSHDGNLLAFLSFDAIGVIDIRAGRVKKKYARDPRSGIKVSRDDSTEFFDATVSPQFTPDDSALAYVAHGNGVDNVWGQPLDGRSPYPLTHFKSDEIRDFHWSPSGKRFAIVRGRTESNVVLIRDANP